MTSMRQILDDFSRLTVPGDVSEVRGASTLLVLAKDRSVFAALGMRGLVAIAWLHLAAYHFIKTDSLDMPGPRVHRGDTMVLQCFRCSCINCSGKARTTEGPRQKQACTIMHHHAPVLSSIRE